ncbi:hypothetical protein Golob_000999, partial [Gossypium lobatum]|nr:hypothetical protein [Gossypium lobatum]
MLLYSHLQGYVMTSSAYVVTLKAVSNFLYSAFNVVTLDLPYGDIESSIGPKCLLMDSCTLAMYVSSPLGLNTKMYKERSRLRHDARIRRRVFLPGQKEFYLALKEREAKTPFYDMRSSVKVRGANVL